MTLLADRLPLGAAEAAADHLSDALAVPPPVEFGCLLLN
jgi:hypothetical protein